MYSQDREYSEREAVKVLEKTLFKQVVVVGSY